MTMLYGYPSVGRFGLAHSMLAWARCVVWCHDRGIPMLAPQWLQPRIGPHLRGEREKREYFRLFSSGDAISGMRRIVLLATANRIRAEKELPDRTFVPHRNTLVVFKNPYSDNFRKHFGVVFGRHNVVWPALGRMTRPRFLPPARHHMHMAMHILPGDFSAGTDVGTSKSGINNARLPLGRYSGMVLGIHARRGRVVPTTLHSDVSDEERSTILAVPGVRRSLSPSVVTDMLSIAQAALLISSGSGFAAWGRYFGQVTRLCFSGLRKVRMLQSRFEQEQEPECKAAGSSSITFSNV